VLTLKNPDNTYEKIEIPNVPTDLAAAVEVDGANGTTEKILAVLKKLAETLEAKGEAYADDAALIRNIANEGFYGARLQKSVEDGLAQSEGKSFSKVTMVDPETGKSTFISTIVGLNFINTINAFENPQKIKNPAIRAIVTMLTGQLTQSFASSAKFIQEGGNNGDMSIKADSLKASIMNQSKESTQNSGKICESSIHNEVASLSCVDHVSQSK
jgi:hypothetical protein